MDRTSGPSTTPLQRGPAVASTPLLDIEVFRPGAALALGILMLPVLVALGGAFVCILLGGGVPEWLPFLALLWIPCAPVFWLAMQSVRTNAGGIAAGRPWNTWVEIPWTFVERVEQVGPLVVFSGSNSRRLVLMPFLLRDGDRLRRMVLLRLPSHVLVGKLSRDQQRILRTGYFIPDTGLTGSLQTRPQHRWRLLMIAVAAVLIGGATAAVEFAPMVVSIVVVFICALLLLVTVLTFGWLLQIILINEKGISVVSPLTRRSREMAWPNIDIIEHSPHQVILRFRGTHRLLSAGPPLLPASDRELLHAFLNEYCINNGVPFVPRSWLM